jgi:uncharacterized membrane protein
MKTDKIYFHCMNNEADSDLVRAVEILQDRDMLIIPSDAEVGCLKKDGKIVIYPYNPKEQLFIIEHTDLEEYGEYPAYSEFKLKGFSYEVLRNNPFIVYERIIGKGLYWQVNCEEPKKEKTIEDCVWIATSKR